MGNPEEVNRVLDEWEKREKIDPIPQKRDLPAKNKYGTSVLSQTVHLWRRHAKLVIRDPTLYLGRAIMFLVACTFFSIIYFEARERVQTQVLYRTFLLMWYVGVPSSLGVIAVFAFNMEYFAIKREIKDGMFSPAAYLCSNMLLQIPLMIILAVFVLCIGPYAVSKFYGPNFVKMMLLIAVALWSFETMGQFFSILFKNPLIGMLLYLCMWFSSFLFAGVMVPEEDVIWPFRVFAYVLPMRWTLASMATVEFRDVTFSGAIVDPGMPTGFRCEGDDPMIQLQCYGVTGQQVLASLGQQFKSFGPDDIVARDIGYLTGTTNA